jgi:DNA-binding NarL/FixJ family response regulator
MIMKRPRVLLADDHTLLLEAFRNLLEPEFEIVGAVEDGRALLSAAAKLNPDIILLDITMPLLSGLEAARCLRKQRPHIKLIFLTMHTDPIYVAEAMRAGASGYLLKRSAASELVTAIREVFKDRVYVTPLVTKSMVESLLEGPPKPNALTPRQREVLQLTAEGHAVKSIASILNISPRTVEFHQARIKKALGAFNTAELTRYAIKHGIVAA